MKRKKKIKRTIIHAMRLPSLFGPWFADKDSWKAWVVVLKALFCLPMHEEELKLFEQHTGRKYAPTVVREFWAIVGRRGGKSLIAALIAVYLACFREYSQYLAPGEVGTVMVIAADRKQARVVLRYAKAFIKEVPALARMVQNETKESIELTNRIVIEVHTASYTTTRGYTCIACILEELAFFPTEDSASPDTEIIEALRPGMATIPGAILIAISSPYSRRGALWEAYKQHFGKDESASLVWQADSASMNPTLNQNTINEAYERDESKASAEWGARFRSDLEDYVSKEVVDACTVTGRTLLPFNPQFTYHGFTDPSGGSKDSFTLAIAHNENGKGILSVLLEKKSPFSPESVIADYAEVLKSYGIHEVTGDKYAGEFPRELFRKFGVEYKTSELSRSQIYLEFLPLMNSGRVELLDLPRLKAQLVGLERRTGRGADVIDHPPHGADDCSNVAAGCALLAIDNAIAPMKYTAADRAASQRYSRYPGQNKRIAETHSFFNHGNTRAAERHDFFRRK